MSVASGPVTTGLGSPVTQALARARAEGRAALIGYLPAGFPSVQGGIDAMLTMADAGVDIIEVGLPYSDPLMDGPTIQRAAERALAGGTTPVDVIATVAAVSPRVAVVVMSSWNPIERYGADRFAADLAAAGGSGVILPDIIPDEAAPWIAAAAAHGLDTTFLVAPSSTDKRIASTAAATSGFLYATAVMGVTGVRSAVGQAAEPLVRRVRSFTDLPVCVGLGVSDGRQAAEVAAYADGVIVGSALVATLLDAPTPEQGLAALGALTRDLAEGVRRGRPAAGPVGENRANEGNAGRLRDVSTA